jgi:hypothetical protein
LAKAEATIEMEKHIPIEVFQEALKNDGGNYSIHPWARNSRFPEVKKEKPKANETGTFYCPMHCEGDKTYDKPGDCPVCGMDLVAVQSDLSTEEKTNKTLLKKFWIASVFTLPIFLIAMSEMLSQQSII